MVQRKAWPALRPVLLSADVALAEPWPPEHGAGPPAPPPEPRALALLTPGLRVEAHITPPAAVEMEAEGTVQTSMFSFTMPSLWLGTSSECSTPAFIAYRRARDMA